MAKDQTSESRTQPTSGGSAVEALRERLGRPSYAMVLRRKLDASGRSRISSGLSVSDGKLVVRHDTAEPTETRLEPISSAVLSASGVAGLEIDVWALVKESGGAQSFDPVYLGSLPRNQDFEIMKAFLRDHRIPIVELA
jgi:hypothetical protein